MKNIKLPKIYKIAKNVYRYDFYDLTNLTFNKGIKVLSIYEGLLTFKASKEALNIFTANIIANNNNSYSQY